SFFKNPIISKELFEILKEKHPAMPAYPAEENTMKVPAGWLIEQAGWKGKRIGNAGSYEKQALVLVNHGGASGTEIWNLATKIIESVNDQFQIRLNPEVNIWR
ncbi:MAG: UDP-N-acetylenolpyruvoylglucosamine reductase, partial [Saprospiraceae bacterium]